MVSMRKDFIVGKVRVATLPICNFDNKPAKFDAPTRMGPWAHMCPECASEKGVNVESLGTEFVLGIAEPKGGDPVNGILDIDRSMTTGFLMITCPECNDEKHLELDADGTYVCDGCGSTVNIPTLL